MRHFYYCESNCRIFADANLGKIDVWGSFPMCSKPKFCLKIILAKIRVWELFTRKLNFFHLCQNCVFCWRPGYLRLKELPRISFSLTADTTDTLEIRVLLFAMFYFKLKVGSSVASAFHGLDNLQGKTT